MTSSSWSDGWLLAAAAQLPEHWFLKLGHLLPEARTRSSRCKQKSLASPKNGPKVDFHTLTCRRTPGLRWRKPKLNQIARSQKLERPQFWLNQAVPPCWTTSRCSPRLARPSASPWPAFGCR